MIPFPGLDETTRYCLAARHSPWGESDPDRDLWDCQKEHPGIRVEGSILSLTTSPIIIENKRRRYRMGIYHIRIDMRDGSLSIKQEIKGTIRYHPHHKTYSDGICLGQAQYHFNKACLQGRWGDALTILLSWAKTFNSHDAKRGFYKDVELTDQTCPGCAGLRGERESGLCDRCEEISRSL